MNKEKYRIKQNEYDKAHMKGYSVNMPIALYNEMMEEVERTQTNRNAYTIQAIREKLERATTK